MIDFNSIRHESIHIVSITDQLKPVFLSIKVQPKSRFGLDQQVESTTGYFTPVCKIFHDIRSPNVFNNKRWKNNVTPMSVMTHLFPVFANQSVVNFRPHYYI
jgi:hypothetical protein